MYTLTSTDDTGITRIQHVGDMTRLEQDVHMSLPVSTPILEYVRDFYAADAEPQVQEWANRGLPILVELTRVAEYLGATRLLNFCCRAINAKSRRMIYVDMIRNQCGPIDEELVLPVPEDDVPPAQAHGGGGGGGGGRGGGN